MEHIMLMPQQLSPIGLIEDTLRLEKGYCLYGK